MKNTSVGGREQLYSHFIALENSRKVSYLYFEKVR